MCISTYMASLFDNIVASLHLGLDTAPEPLSSLGTGVPRDVDRQRGGRVVGGFVNIPLTNALKVVSHEIF